MAHDPTSEIRRLVEAFTAHRESYAHPAYKEAQLRQEFIDPMWKALGWDIDNEQGYAEQYKDVIHEDAIKVSELYRVSNKERTLIEIWSADTTTS